MADAAAKATEEQKRALILAHPDLAGKLGARQDADGGVDGRAGERRAGPAEPRGAGAGSPQLNDAYRARFGFPFIMAVKGKTKADILAAFERRRANDADAETRTALAEINNIAALRIKDILS